MSTPINPFIRGYHDLTVQRQLVVHVEGDCPVIHRPFPRGIVPWTILPFTP